MIEVTRSQFAMRALDRFFVKPVFTVPEFIEAVNIPPQTARRIVRQVREGGLLSVIRDGGGQRPMVLAFTELLNIAEERRVL